MTDIDPYRVETTSRLAQWRISNLSSCTYRKSDPFRMGNWNWNLSVEKNRLFYIKLYPVLSNLNKDRPPIVSFSARIRYSLGELKILFHPAIEDKQLKNSDDFVWVIETPLAGKLIIDIEFLDLKIASHQGGEPASIWTTGSTKVRSSIAALTSLGRMLVEDIHTDITIKASDGSVRAHVAVLAARSPVFRSMFSHNLKEKELSTIDISDMSIEACHAFLSYMYGSISPEEFSEHKLALLRAADKYDVADLKEACHDSLVDDIDANNVLERLQHASLYQLPVLKCCCLRYLVNFGKIFDMKEEMNAFLRCADRELVVEVFQEVLSAWKGF